MTTYRIEIDRSLCSGFGACVELAPKVFELGENGIASLRVGEGTSFRIGQSTDPAVFDAADACPMGAITVTEIREEAA
jgi:ferredoxin